MKCNFCSTNMTRGTGKMFVKTDGKVLYFCSSKCEKNFLKLKRKPRTTAWTGEYTQVKKEEAATKNAAKNK